MKRHAFYLNRDREIRLFIHCWIPDYTQEIKGVVQLAHGMAEHIMRYDAFSSFLASQGFIVIGNDHRGHGRSIQAPDDWGFLAEQKGFDKLTEDMYTVTQYIQKEYPGLPVFLLGHSMGSFLTRRYIQFYSETLSGVLLLGTGGSQGMLGKLGLTIAKWERRRKGPRSPSFLMNKLTFGQFNNAFQPARTAFDFLNRDTSAVDAYIQDPLCGFICSTSFYIDLLDGIEFIHLPRAQRNISKKLPIILLSGDTDPVGKFGDGVREAHNMYRRIGIRDVQIQLYANARHDLLHETNKEEVYNGILTWLENKL